MSINTAFYQIAKNVTVSDLAKIIGAKIIGIETNVTKRAIIKDIAFLFICFSINVGIPDRSQIAGWTQG